MILTLAPAVSAAPPSACEPFPGNTTIRWNSLDLTRERRDSVVRCEWECHPIGDGPGRKGRPFHRQPTPQGTEEFGASFFDESGNAIGVTGGVCGAT